VCNFRDAVRKATVGKAILDYLNKEGKTGNVTSDIAWTSLEIAMKEVSRRKRRWISKQTSGRCAVGVEMKRRRKWSHSKCPRCDELFETSEHVLQCTGEGTEAIWTIAIADFRKWLATQLTNNVVADLICSSLTGWRDGTAPPVVRSNLLHLKLAMEDQRDIGWGAAMEGRWSSYWIKIQENHFRKLKRRRSGKRWLTSIIKQMWNISWDLWDHRNQVQLERATEERRAKNAVNIRMEYGLGPVGLDNLDAKLFTNPMEEILTGKLQKQDAWIRRVTMARKRSASNAVHQEQHNYLNFYNLLRDLRRRERSGTVPATTPNFSVQQPTRRRIIRVRRPNNQAAS
jgi:hypothetical protein